MTWFPPPPPPKKKKKKKIYIYIYRFAELDYLVEDIYCYSEFHASCEAIIRQLPKITDTFEDIQNLKIQNNA